MARKTYTDTEVDQGLLALALADGSPTRANEHLPAGLTIPSRTLRRWAKVHVDRYRELEAVEKPKLVPDMVDGFRQTITTATEVGLLALEKTREQLAADGTKDPAGAARNLATVAGIATDKLHAITGKPNLTVEVHHTVEQDLRVLEQLGVAQLDIPDADVVDDGEEA